MCICVLFLSENSAPQADFFLLFFSLMYDLGWGIRECMFKEGVLSVHTLTTGIKVCLLDCITMGYQ